MIRPESAVDASRPFTTDFGKEIDHRGRPPFDGWRISFSRHPIQSRRTCVKKRTSHQTDKAAIGVYGEFVKKKMGRQVEFTQVVFCAHFTCGTSTVFDFGSAPMVEPGAGGPRKWIDGISV